jgi:hypothetical protein
VLSTTTHETTINSTKNTSVEVTLPLRRVKSSEDKGESGNDGGPELIHVIEINFILQKMTKKTIIEVHKQHKQSSKEEGVQNADRQV